MDRSCLRCVQGILGGPATVDEELALGVIADVGPGNGPLDHADALAHMREQSSAAAFAPCGGAIDPEAVVELAHWAASRLSEGDRLELVSVMAEDELDALVAECDAANGVKA